MTTNKQKINDAFEKGWRFGSWDSSAGNARPFINTARAVANCYPEYEAFEVNAFLNGYDDGLVGDTFRLHGSK